MNSSDDSSHLQLKMTRECRNILVPLRRALLKFAITTAKSHFSKARMH